MESLECRPLHAKISAEQCQINQTVEGMPCGKCQMNGAAVATGGSPKGSDGGNVYTRSDIARMAGVSRNCVDWYLSQIVKQGAKTTKEEKVQKVLTSL